MLWSFDKEESAWERNLPEGGSAHRKYALNESVEVKQGDFLMRGQVQSERKPNGLVEVKIEQHPGHYTTISVPPKNLLYYPPAMNMHVATTSENEKLMYVHPGKGKTGKPMLEMWAYSFEKDTWTQLHWPRDSATPEPREMHTGVRVGGGLLIYGGNRAKETFDDAWLFSFSRSAWSRVRPAFGSPRPPPLWGASSVAYGNTMWLFGGHDNESSCVADLWSLDWDTKTWRRHDDDDGGPAARKGHSAVVYGHCMIVYGGHDSSAEFMNDLWAFDFEEETWREVELDAKAPPRNFHKAEMLGSVMYMFGGNNDDGLLNDFWSIDLAGLC